jgi:outer membrane protein OmpA-like peptidoglycan-associated protein
LIDDAGLSLRDASGQPLVQWEKQLPSAADRRKAVLLEYFDSLGYPVEVIEIHNIYYDYDKSLIRNDASKDLDRIVHLLEENPGLKISLNAHTDSRGTDGYNRALAVRRAQAARSYLINEGIAPHRIVHAASGEKQLVNDCGNAKKCDENAHQLNRRTEFQVAFKK